MIKIKVDGSWNLEDITTSFKIIEVLNKNVELFSETLGHLLELIGIFDTRFQNLVIL